MSPLARLILALVVAGQVPAERQNPQPIAPLTERMDKQFDFYPGGKVAITSEVAGNLKVIGWNRSSVRIEAEKIVYQLPTDQARALAAQFPMAVRYTATSATIRFPGAPAAGSAVEINVLVYVPGSKTDLAVRLAKGDASVDRINGWIEVNLEDGSLEAKSLEGYVSGATRRGDITVELAGRRWLGHGFMAATLAGRVALRVPALYSAALQLETRDGDISVDYPEQMVDGEKVPLNVVTSKNARSLKATLGDGGAPVRLLTRAGDIRLEAIPQERR